MNNDQPTKPASGRYHKPWSTIEDERLRLFEELERLTSVVLYSRNHPAFVRLVAVLEALGAYR